MSKKMNCTPKVRQKTFGVQFKMKFSIQLIIIDQRVFVLAINPFTTLLRSSSLEDQQTTDPLQRKSLRVFH